MHLSVTSKAVPSVYFSFFCLLVSSVSNFHPDTRGRWWSLFLGSLVQYCCGEGGTLLTNITGMCGECLQCLPHWAYPNSQHVCFPSLHCSDSRLLCQELSDAGRGLHALPGLSCSGSGSLVLHKGADLVGPAFCAHPRSEQLR